MTDCCTLDKSVASLYTSHLGDFPWMAIWLNLYGTALFEQVINIERLIEMWMFVYVCIIQSSRSRIKDVLPFISIINIPFK